MGYVLWMGWSFVRFFIRQKNTKHYIGTEPSTKTFDGLLKMKKDFSYLGKQVDIYCKGSEEFLNQKKNHSIYVLHHHLILILKNIFK